MTLATFYNCAHPITHSPNRPKFDYLQGWIGCIFEDCALTSKNGWWFWYIFGTFLSDHVPGTNSNPLDKSVKIIWHEHWNSTLFDMGGGFCPQLTRSLAILQRVGQEFRDSLTLFLCAFVIGRKGHFWSLFLKILIAKIGKIDFFNFFSGKLCFLTSKSETSMKIGFFWGIIQISRTILKILDFFEGKIFNFYLRLLRKF